jgi:CHAT domain
MANNPIHLTILRRGDVHIVDLAEVQAIIPRSETRVEATFLEEISQEVKRITKLVGPEFRKAAVKLEPEARRNPHVVRELKNLGSLIFSHLLPQAARDKLRSAESCNLYLRLDDQLVHIPWELAFDGQHFLGMKFRVGRQVITHHKVTQTAPVRPSSGALRMLLISDPSETLKNVSREGEQLCEILDRIPGLQVRLLGGRGVKRIPLLAALRESDIVHFAGHSQFDEKNPENSGWLLHDGFLSASEISKLDQAPLLVFSNSCQAGATKNWQSDYLYEGEAFGLGSAFLLAGVPNYIGTFCVVHDEESRFLAVEFYRRVTRGKAIGEALLEARVATAEEMGLDRLTWASYMLYGDPSFSPMTLGRQVTPSPSASTAKIMALPRAEPQVSGNGSPHIKPDRRKPIVNERVLGWLAAGLVAVVLTSFLLFKLWKPTEVAKTSESQSSTNAQIARLPTAPAGHSSGAQPSQDLGDIKVDVNHLQVVPEQRQVIVFFKIVNKTSKDLAVVRGDSQPFVTDNQGYSYDFRDSSGIKVGQVYQQNWTSIPPSGEHTVSMRFGNYNSQPKRDSLYSVSTELVLTSRDNLERTPAGQRPDGARTVNIAIHQIQAD